MRDIKALLQIACIFFFLEINHARPPFRVGVTPEQSAGVGVTPEQESGVRVTPE